MPEESLFETLTAYHEELAVQKRDDIMAAHQEFEQGHMRSAHYCTGAKLGSTATDTTVRLTNGKPAVPDGPFAETKEAIGGYHLIACSDLDEAIAIALRIPTLPAGGVIEIRPVEHAPADGRSVLPRRRRDGAVDDPSGLVSLHVPLLQLRLAERTRKWHCIRCHVVHSPYRWLPGGSQCEFCWSKTTTPWPGSS